jgi:predicted ATPase
VGLDETDSPEEVREKLVRVFREEEEAELFAQRVAEVVGLAEGTAGAEERSTVVQALFEALSRSQPVVLVFDDIHWGEATFLDLVEHLADSMSDAPVLLICIARPELLDVRPGWGGGKVNATTVLLEPLSEVESAQLVDNLARGDDLEPSLRLRVIEAAEGNPLFVEEMLALALEDGEGSAELLVPPTIQALLAARLDRLGDEERAVIELAAVEGKVFHEHAVAELGPEGLRPAVSTALTGLIHKELIRPDRRSLGGRAYRFRHLLIRDAAYDSISKEARADMHERYARWLDGIVGARAAEYEEIIGHHLEQAYLCRTELGSVDENGLALAYEAAERLGAAARRAFVRSDAPAGVNLISRAAGLLPPDNPQRVALIPNVRVVQGMGGDMSWAERVLTEAVEAAATTGDRGLAAHALVQRGFLRLFTDPHVRADELVDTAQRTIAVFEDLNDELGLARAWRLLAQSHYLDRKLGACAEASERALVHARRAPDRFEEREIVEWLVIALFLGPAPAAQAAVRCRSLLHESKGDKLMEAQILGALVFLTAIQGGIEEAEELIEAAKGVMHELGEWLWIHSWHVAFISMIVSDPASAEDEIRPAYDALKKIGEKSHFSSMAHALALAVYNQGRYEEAELLARECEEAARANDVNSRIIARTMLARALAQKGEFAAAESAARQAVALAAGSDLYVAHGDALSGLAEVLALSGRPDEAAPVLAEALRLYGLKGDVVSAARARTRSPLLELVPET